MSESTPAATAAETTAAAPEQTTVTPGTSQETPWNHDIWDAENKDLPGRFAPKWQERLPAEYEEYKGMLANYDSLLGLVKSTKDFMTQARTKGNVKPLTPESTPEDVANYRKNMGIPETPYELPKPENLPEGFAWNDERMKAVGKEFHDANLTPKQVEKALEVYMKVQTEDRANSEQAFRAAMDTNLATERQYLADKYRGGLDSAVNDAKRTAIQRQFPLDAVEPNSSKFLGHEFFDLCVDYARAVGESKMPSAAAVVNTDPRRQALDIVSNPSNPLHALWKKGDKAVRQKVESLNKAWLEAGGKP